VSLGASLQWVRWAKSWYETGVKVPESWSRFVKCRLNYITFCRTYFRISVWNLALLLPDLLNFYCKSILNSTFLSSEPQSSSFEVHIMVSDTTSKLTSDGTSVRWWTDNAYPCRTLPFEGSNMIIWKTQCSAAPELFCQFPSSYHKQLIYSVKHSAMATKTAT